MLMESALYEMFGACLKMLWNKSDIKCEMTSEFWGLSVRIKHRAHGLVIGDVSKNNIMKKTFKIVIF